MSNKSLFHFEPRKKLITLVPKQNIILEYRLLEKQFYFNPNAYVDSKKILIDEINVSKDYDKLELKFNKKSKRIKVEFKVNSYLLQIIESLNNNRSYLGYSPDDKDEFAFTFDDNSLENFFIDFREDAELLNSTRIYFKNGKLYYSVVQPETDVIIDRIELKNNQLSLISNNVHFRYPLNLNDSYKNIISQFFLLIDNNGDENKNSFIKEEKDESLSILTHGINSFIFKFLPDVGYICITLFHKGFYYDTHENLLYYDLNKDGISRFAIINELKFVVEKNSIGLYIKYLDEEENFTIPNNPLNNLFLRIIHNVFEKGIEQSEFKDKINISLTEGKFDYLSVIKLNQVEKKIVNTLLIGKGEEESGYLIETQEKEGYYFVKETFIENESLKIKTDKELFTYLMDAPKMIVNAIRDLLDICLT